jgi:phage antirepressor YoqD-like protein
MTDLVLNGDKRMTVKEVADALGVDDSTITKRVKAIFPDIVRNGVTTYLTEPQVVAVKQSLIENGHLGQLSEVKAATTELEMLLLDEKVSRWKSQKIAELSKQVDQQKIQIAELEPKAEFYDAVTGSADTIEIGEVAKILAIKNMGRNNLFQLLRDNAILMQNNQPYQKYIDCGYFRTIESRYTKPDGTTHINIKTVVYQKGIDYIRKVAIE